MKLHATIENENRKKVGKGGDESLTLSLNRGNMRMVEFYLTIEELSDGEELVVIDMLNLSDGETTRVYEREGCSSFLPEYTVEKTGEKQKGECQQTGCNKETMRPYAWCKKHFGERLAQSGGFLQD